MFNNILCSNCSISQTGKCHIQVDKTLDVVYDNTNSVEIYCNLPESSEEILIQYYCIPADSNLLRVTRLNVKSGDHLEGFYRRFSVSTKNGEEVYCWERCLVWLFFDSQNKLISRLIYSNGTILEEYSPANFVYTDN